MHFLKPLFFCSQVNIVCAAEQIRSSSLFLKKNYNVYISKNALKQYGNDTRHLKSITARPWTLKTFLTGVSDWILDLQSCRSALMRVFAWIQNMKESKNYLVWIRCKDWKTFCITAITKWKVSQQKRVECRFIRSINARTTTKNILPSVSEKQKQVYEKVMTILLFGLSNQRLLRGWICIIGYSRCTWLINGVIANKKSYRRDASKSKIRSVLCEISKISS